jgi:hypothetical protein
VIAPLRRTGLVWLCGLAALLAPSLARAHDGITYIAAPQAQAPTIDGTIGASEWAAATSYSLGFAGHPGTVRFLRDGNYLYVAATVSDTSPTSANFSVIVDNNHDGIKNLGDDLIAAYTGGPGAQGANNDFFWSPVSPPCCPTGGASHYPDVYESGTSDVLGAGTVDATSASFEMRHPLRSTDTAHDFVLSVLGGTLGVDFQYQAAATPFVRYPGLDATNPSDWADLVVGGDTTPPTVSITNPPGGSDLQGLVHVTADASDDLGVDHVTFEYFDGVANQTTPLGTDSTAPYAVDFNTRTVPNRPHNASTIYAQAFDAAGNASTKMGVGVGIVNRMPTVHGSLTNDFVFLVDFPPNVPVSVTVGGSANAVQVTTDGSGRAAISPAAHHVDLVPGVVLTADDGSIVKQLTLEFISIDSVTPANDVVSGRAPPLRSVRVVVFHGGSEVANVTTPSNADGFWTVTPPVDIVGGDHLLADVAEPNGDGDRSRADFDVPTGLLSITTSLAADASSVAAGGAVVPESAIPTAALTGAASTTTKSAPIEQIPIDHIPIEQIDLAHSPIEQIPIDHIGFTAENLVANALGGVPLEQIPLTPPNTWEAKLATTVLANVPVQTLTLADVVRSAPSVLAGMHFSDLNLASSPIEQISLASVALGTLPIEQIPIDHIGTDIDTAWCNLIHGIPGFADYDCAQIPTTTLMTLTLQGVPIEQIPIEQIPIDHINLTGTPIEQIALHDVDIADSPIEQIPIEQINFAYAPIEQISLGALAHPEDVVTCATFTCDATHTVGGAFAAGKLQPGATFGDLAPFPGLKLGDLPHFLPPDVTLADVLALLIGPPAYDWDKLPQNFPLQDFASEGGSVNYAATFRLNGTGAPVDATIRIVLTNGERYKPGSVSLTNVAISEPQATLNGDVETLTWNLANVPLGANFTLRFTARAGNELGRGTATATVTSGGIGGSSAPVTVTVTDTFESNDTAANARPAAKNTLYTSFITGAADRDYFTIPIPPAGTLTKVFAERLPADYDLVAYGPATPSLRAAPIEQIPIDHIPLAETEQTLDQRNQEISPETLSDVPRNGSPGQVVVGTSDARGTAPEEVDLVSTGQSGSYTIQVTGYNGASSDLPYLLRVEQVAPPALPACPARSFVGGGTAGTMPSVPANANTLFLVNAKQLGDLYGATAESNVLQALGSLTNQFGVVGAVIPVETNPAVAAAYASWNANPCSPALANDVMRAIGALVDNLSSGRPIQNIVLVGNDDVVPMARLADPSPIANESEYASALGFSTASPALYAAANHFLLSDDPYGSPSPTKFNGGELYIPSVAVGRLVETPDDIVTQVNQFVAARGSLDPKTELVSGYGFLSDGAQAVGANLRAAGRTGTDLISESWTRDQLVNAMFPSTGSQPAIMAPNAHYDHNRLLPADQSAAHKQDVLFTAGQLAARGAGATTRALVLTIGCHSGFGASDLWYSGNAAVDWAQTYLGVSRAAMFAAMTGYGLGDTVAVAYSEKLQSYFAQRLDGSLSTGRALAFAKQDYYAALGTLSVYDPKVVNEATLYGLPMWTLGNVAPPTPPEPAPTFTDGSTGLPAASFTVAPTFQRFDDPRYGSYFAVGGNIVDMSRRPIEPSTFVDVTQPGLTAHDALITSIDSFTDLSPFDAAYGRPVVDSSSLEPEVVGQTVFPTRLQTIRSFTAPTGRQQRLVVIAGQYRSDATPDSKGIGVQRLFNRLTARVFYSGSSDFTAPSLGPVTLTMVGTGLVGFALDVADAGAVKRVLVLYRDGNTWRSLDLGSSTGGHWSGAGALAGISTEYYLQAVDAAGNVAVTSDKGLIKAADQQQQSGAVVPNVAGPRNGDWFTGAASVTFTAPAGVTVDYRLDAGDSKTYTGAAIAVNGDGVHDVVYSATDGSKGVLVIPIDTTGPVISTTDRSYVLGSTGNRFDVACTDAGSGAATCDTTPDVPDTSAPVGAKTFTVRAVDRVGNVSTATGTYHVVWPFRGFLQPLSNRPVVNVVGAGQAVPVKFGLGGNRGLEIFATGSPSSEPIACDTQAPLDTTITTVTAGNSSLTYDAATDQYSYVWKTDKAWAGQCRQLTMKFVDGSQHIANFKLK